MPAPGRRLNPGAGRAAGRERLLADHSTTGNALQLPPGARVCLAQFGHSHTQFEAAFTKAMRRAATTAEAGACAAFRILRALADTTSSYTGESAARLVDVVGDVLVQALSVTFPLRQITVPAYYRNVAAGAATYVTEETEKARKEAKEAAIKAGLLDDDFAGLGGGGGGPAPDAVE